MRLAIYPGTFDPITRGHHEIIRRGCKLFDRLVIAVSEASPKNPTLTLDERFELVKADVATVYPPEIQQRIDIKVFRGLLVNFARTLDAQVVLRGLRAISDFEFEVQMAAVNYRLEKNIETIFLPATEQHQFVSSSFVREIAGLGGDISSFVTPTVCQALGKKLKSKAS